MGGHIFSCRSRRGRGRAEGPWPEILLVLCMPALLRALRSGARGRHGWRSLGSGSAGCCICCCSCSSLLLTLMYTLPFRARSSPRVLSAVRRVVDAGTDGGH